MSLRAILLVVVVCAAGACGGSARPERPAGTSATRADVLVLARVLEANLAHGGARFTASLDVDGERALATGRVDFRSGRGSALIRPADARRGPPRRYFWTRRTVLAETAPSAHTYARQPPDPQGDPVHAMIGFVNLLAAETIDNTANLQDHGVRVIGRGTIDGTPVDEYRFGTETTLWLAHGDRLLRRVHTTRVPGGLTIDLTSHEAVKINLPRAG